MSPQHEAAHNEIKARAAAADAGDSVNAWRHAALVVAQFTDPARALKQLHQHASFTSSPEKKAAYAKAAEVFTELTGVTLPKPLPAEVTRQDIAFTALDHVLPGFALACHA